MIAVITDVVRQGKPVVGYAFASVGRFAQGGLIRERFAPRLLDAADAALVSDEGTNLDPFRAWAAMMAGEKPGGHGERCVAVSALDMAIWDATAKIAGLPLYRFLARRLGREPATEPRVRVYAAGGYVYPADDVARLSEDMRRFVELGFTHAKIKIGSAGLTQDQRRIEAAAAQLPAGLAHLAVDAIYAYDAKNRPCGGFRACPVRPLVARGRLRSARLRDPGPRRCRLPRPDRRRRGAVLGGRGQAARPTRRVTT